MQPALAHARRMRSAPSATEALLWKLLRNRKLHGVKFRRQVPLGRFIVDFVCQRHRLIVEADGPFHDPEHDAIRDAWLVTQGYRVLRFANREITSSPEAILNRILITIAPSPLAGEGVGEADG